VGTKTWRERRGEEGTKTGWNGEGEFQTWPKLLVADDGEGWIKLGNEFLRICVRHDHLTVLMKIFIGRHRDIRKFFAFLVQTP
jgi:hypothetical protein